jgi:hypothetical protein
MTGTQSCYVYILNSFEGGIPSQRYLEIMVAAAIEAGAPDDYIAEIRNRGVR